MAISEKSALTGVVIFDVSKMRLFQTMWSQKK